MFESLTCLFKGHRFSFTPEFLNKFHPADDNAIRCRCSRCGEWIDLITGHARRIAPGNPKVFLKTEKELLDYCNEYLDAIRHVHNRPVFRKKDVDTLHITYPEHLRTLFEE